MLNTKTSNIDYSKIDRVIIEHIIKQLKKEIGKLQKEEILDNEFLKHAITYFREINTNARNIELRRERTDNKIRI